MNTDTIITIDNDPYLFGYELIESNDGNYLRIFNKWTTRPLVTKVTHINLFQSIFNTSVAHQHIMAHLSLPLEIANTNSKSLLIQFAMMVKEFVDRLVLDGVSTSKACEIGNNFFFTGKVEEKVIINLSSSSHYFYNEAKSYFNLMMTD